MAGVSVKIRGLKSLEAKLGRMPAEARKGVRRLKQIELLEISLVTFPANPKARVQTVKAQLDAGELPSERDFERLLREAGLSQRESKAFVAGGYRAFPERRDPDTLDGELLDSIRRAAAVWR